MATTIPIMPVTPFRPADPTEQMQRLQQIAAMGQEQKLRQQQIDAGVKENQQRAQSLKDQQAMTQALEQWDGKDPEQLPSLVIKSGGSSNAVFGIQKQLQERKRQLSEMAKSDAETGSTNLKNMQTRNDMVLGGLNSVLDAPDEELGPRLLSTAQDLARQGLLDPEHTQTAQQLAQLPPDQMRAQLGLMKKGMMSESQQMKLAAEQAELARNQAQLPGVQADSELKQAEAGGMKQGMVPQAMADSKYRFIKQREAAGIAASADEQAFAKGYEKQKLLVPQTTAQIRVEGYGQNREYPVIDTKNGNSLSYASASDINAANRQEPGRYLPAGEGGKALNKTALIEDIRGNINAVRANLNNEKMPEFTAVQRGQIAVALGGQNPGGALNSMLRGGILGDLTDDQQDYLVNMAQLTENAMAMRSVLGAGQGSEDLRDAIRATIPGPRMPSKRFGMQQLDAFEAVLNRLSRGVPSVPLRSNGTQPAPSGGPGANHSPGARAGLPEGATGKGSDGKSYVVKGGVWVAQ